MSETNVKDIAQFSLSMLLNKVSASGPKLLRILGISAALAAVMWLGSTLATTILSTTMLGFIPIFLVIIATPVITLYTLMPGFNAFLKNIVLPESLVEQEILSIAIKHDKELDPQIKELCVARLEDVNKRIDAIKNCPANIIEASPAGLVGATCALTTACLVAPVAMGGIIPSAVTAVVGANLGNFAYDIWRQQAPVINPENLQLAAGIPTQKPTPVL